MRAPVQKLIALVTMLAFVSTTWPFGAFNPLLKHGNAAGGGGGGGPTLLLNENCEGTGTPSGWTDDVTVSWDYTSTVLNGAQSMDAQGSGGNASRYDLGTTYTELYGKLLVRVVSGANGLQVLTMRDASNTHTVFSIQFTATDLAIIDGGSGSGTTTVGSITTGVKYWVWWHYKTGSGSNAIGEIWISTTSTQPANGSSSYATFTNGTETLPMQKPEFGVWSGTGHEVILDDMQIAQSAIP